MLLDKNGIEIVEQDYVAIIMTSGDDLMVKTVEKISEASYILVGKHGEYGIKYLMQHEYLSGHPVTRIRKLSNVEVTALLLKA